MNKKILAIQNWLVKQPGVNLNVGHNLLEEAITSDNYGIVKEGELFKIGTTEDDFSVGDMVLANRGEDDLLLKEIEELDKENETKWTTYISGDCSRLFIVAEYTLEEEDFSRLYIFDIENIHAGVINLTLREKIELGQIEVDTLNTCDDGKVFSYVYYKGDENGDNVSSTLNFYKEINGAYKLIKQLSFTHHEPFINFSPDGTKVLIYEDSTNDLYPSATAIHQVTSKGLRIISYITSPDEDYYINNGSFLNNEVAAFVGLSHGSNTTLYVAEIKDNNLVRISEAAFTPVEGEIADIMRLSNEMSAIYLSGETFFIEVCKIGSTITEGVKTYTFTNVSNLEVFGDRIVPLSMHPVAGSADIVVDNMDGSYYFECFGDDYIVRDGVLGGQNAAYTVFGYLYVARNENDIPVLAGKLTSYDILSTGSNLLILTDNSIGSSRDICLATEQISEIEGTKYWKFKRVYSIMDTRTSSPA